MFFRNLTLFRCRASNSALLDGLDDALAAHALRAPGPLEFATRGFVAPLGPDSSAMSRTIGDCMLVTIGTNERLLPGAIVNAELAKRVRAESVRRGKPIGGRQRRAIKAEVLDALLPQAFVRASRLNAYIDTRAGWLVFDTVSRKAAESALNTLRDALGSFPVQPLAPAESPRALMTHWLARNALPTDLYLGDECELWDPASGARWKGRGTTLDGDEVAEHLRQGKQVRQLGLELADHISFTLDEDLTIRKLRFLDAAQDELTATEHDSAEAEFDARFALMTLELTRLFAGLSHWFGLERPA